MRRFSFSAIAFRIMGPLRNFRSGKFHAYGQHTVKPENLRQAQFKTYPIGYFHIYIAVLAWWLYDASRLRARKFPGIAQFGS